MYRRSRFWALFQSGLLWTRKRTGILRRRLVYERASFYFFFSFSFSVENKLFPFTFLFFFFSFSSSFYTADSLCGTNLVHAYGFANQECVPTGNSGLSKRYQYPNVLSYTSPDCSGAPSTTANVDDGCGQRTGATDDAITSTVNDDVISTTSTPPAVTEASLRTGTGTDLTDKPVKTPMKKVSTTSSTQIMPLLPPGLVNSRRKQHQAEIKNQIEQMKVQSHQQEQQNEVEKILEMDIQLAATPPEIPTYQRYALTSTSGATATRIILAWTVAMMTVLGMIFSWRD
jgi:hypothetical protein